MLIRKFNCLVVAIFVTSLAGFTHAEDIAKSVAVRLRDSGSLDGYRVKVRAKQGTVWLEGEVSDAKNIAAAVGLAESTAGVERVVNRLAVASQASGRQSNLALPQRAWEDAGVRQPVQRERPAQKLPNAKSALSETQQVGWANEEMVRPESAVGIPARMAATPRPMRMSSSAPVQPVGMRSMSRQEMIGGEQVVPGSMRFYEGSAQSPAQASAPPASMPPTGMPGMAPGGPRPMGAAGVGAPPIPMRGDGPNVPNYAWPSYASSPNYAALQYPTQYSPAAWPYIGPFYPYPQVPLGWRRVSLEWDDGWWYVDFDERHVHSHHR
jgi:hypothetical protein